MTIRDLDRDHNWERFFVELCSLDYRNEYKWNKKALSREILETYLDDIIDKVIGFKDYIDNDVLRPRNPKYAGHWVITEDDIHIGFQILGLLILQTGSYLPKIVQDDIMYSTTWEYDSQREWARSYESVRKRNLEKFRKAILTHKVGFSISIF